MNGLCGWFGKGELQNAARGLAQMSEHLPPGSRVGTAYPTSNAALFGSGTAPPSALMDPAGSKIVAALVGQVRWKNSDLAALAQQRSTASALIEAYRRHGENLTDQLLGHFALAVLDPAQNRAFLAVDRIGAFPLCYALTTDGELVFGSTTDSVRMHPNVRSTLSAQALYDYLYFHMVPSPGTVYREINKLEPAQCLLYDNGKIHLRHYWLPSFVESSDTPFGQLQDEFLKLLRKSVQHCGPDKSTGAFLSGGTDSSTVSGMLAGLQPEATRTYSIGFAAEGYDEIAYARIASRHFKTQQHEYYVTPQDVANAIPQVARTYDEPFGNSSAIPTLLCAKLAHEDGTKIMLAGDGGDELFAGNARYARQAVFHHYQSIPGALRRGLLEPLFVGLPFSNWLPPTRKIRSYIEQANIPMPDRMESYNFLRRTDPRIVLHEDFLKQVDLEHPITLLREAYHRAPGDSLLNRMLYLDWKITLADNDLRKVNLMCALAGVEVRYPMLDDDLIEFSARVPPALKIKGFKLRYFFKKALGNFLPQEILQKSKHGFGLPFGEWLKTSAPLQEVVYSSLQDFKTRAIVRPEFIDDLINTHRSGHASYYGTMIWVFAFLEQWLQQHKANL